ncbi:MAG: DUF2269 family protein [Flavobacteriia bacterium]|nr:DUF2269 family protein [Flavobacteriia bacterium]
MYILFKIIHVLSAIVAVGVNLTYPIWLMRGDGSSKYQLHILKGVKFLDSYVANPAYILSLISGLGLWYLSGIDVLQTPWLLVSMSLFLMMALLGFGLYSPLLSRQIHLLNSSGINSKEYKLLDRKQKLTGIVLTSMALIIVTLMVSKIS